MPLTPDYQQILHRRQWSEGVKRLHQEKHGGYMKIIGNVGGRAKIKDLGLEIPYNAIITINEFQVNKSTDLQIAIRKGYVKVVEDRGMILRSLKGSTEPPPVQSMDSEIDYNKMAGMVKDMAKDMAKEMMMNTTSFKALAKEMAKEMSKETTSEIKKALDEKIVVSSEQIKKQKDIELNSDNPENVFIDVDDKEIKIKDQKIGKVEEKKANISKSLSKMKRFKRPKKGKSND